MGMTIEEAHGILSNGLANAPSEHEWCVAFELAIDTMRKYQEIEEIVKQYKKFGNIDFSMQIISGVVEDGND